MVTNIWVVEHCNLYHFSNFKGLKKKSAESASTVGSIVSLDCRSDDDMARWKKQIAKKELVEKKDKSNLFARSGVNLVAKTGMLYIHIHIQRISIKFNHGECLRKKLSPSSSKGEMQIQSCLKNLDYYYLTYNLHGTIENLL